MMVAVSITAAAAAEVAALPVAIRGRVASIIARLALWPNVSGAKPLRGDRTGSYRMRTGEYRVIFTVSGQTLTITRIGIRRDVYED